MSFTSYTVILPGPSPPPPTPHRYTWTLRRVCFETEGAVNLLYGNLSPRRKAETIRIWGRGSLPSTSAQLPKKLLWFSHQPFLGRRRGSFHTLHLLCPSSLCPVALESTFSSSPPQASLPAWQTYLDLFSAPAPLTWYCAGPNPPPSCSPPASGHGQLGPTFCSPGSDWAGVG